MAKSKKAKKPTTKPSRIGPAKIAEMRYLKARGLSARAIAEQAGVSQASAHRYTTPKYKPSAAVRALERPEHPAETELVPSPNTEALNAALEHASAGSLDTESIIRSALAAGKQIIIIGGDS